MSFSNSEIVDAIRTAAKAQHTSIAQIEKSVGFANGTIGKWAKAPKSPPYAKLTAVATALGVPVTELTGETAPAAKKAPGINAEGLSAARKALLDAVDGLTDEQCEKLLGIVLEAKKVL